VTVDIIKCLWPCSYRGVDHTSESPESIPHNIIIIITTLPGPGTAWEKFNAFFVKQSFFSSDLLRFWSLGYPGVKGSDCRGQTCVKNLSGVGAEVFAKFAGHWYGGLHVKEGHRHIGRYKQSFIYKLANRAPALPVKNLMSLRLLEFGVPWGPVVGLVRLCLC